MSLTMGPDQVSGRPLAVPGFARLAASYTLNELGDNFGAIALAILVLDETGSALAVAGVLVAAKFLPAFVAPLLTARLDRRPVSRRAAGALRHRGRRVRGAGVPLRRLRPARRPGAGACRRHAGADGPGALAGRGRDGPGAVGDAAARQRDPEPRLRGHERGRPGARRPRHGARRRRLRARARRGHLLPRRALLLPSRGLPDAAPEAEESADQPAAGRAALRARPAAAAGCCSSARARPSSSSRSSSRSRSSTPRRRWTPATSATALLLTAWGVGILVGSVLYPRLTHRPLGLLVGLSTAAVGAGYIGLAVSPTLGAAVRGERPGRRRQRRAVGRGDDGGPGGRRAGVPGPGRRASSSRCSRRCPGSATSSAARWRAVYSPRVAYAVAGAGVFAMLGIVVTRRERVGRVRAGRRL